MTALLLLLCLILAVLLLPMAFPVVRRLAPLVVLGFMAMFLLTQNRRVTPWPRWMRLRRNTRKYIPPVELISHEGRTPTHS
jgi:hypothetical protein